MTVTVLVIIIVDFSSNLLYKTLRSYVLRDASWSRVRRRCRRRRRVRCVSTASSHSSGSLRTSSQLAEPSSATAQHATISPTTNVNPLTAEKRTIIYEAGTLASPPRSILAVPNVTAHPSTASVPTSYSSTWHHNCLWRLKR